MCIRDRPTPDRWQVVTAHPIEQHSRHRRVAGHPDAREPGREARLGDADATRHRGQTGEEGHDDVDEDGLAELELTTCLLYTSRCV